MTAGAPSRTPPAPLLLGPGVPAAVVFDCDGTLMDMEGCVRAAYDEVFAQYGRTCDAELRASLTGTSLGHMSRAIACAVGAAEAEISTHLTSALIGSVAAHARPLPGAVALLRRIAGFLPVAVASNSGRALLDRTLAHGGLAPYARLTLAADEVARPKPAPDLYLAACAALGVPPEHALAIEDSPVGIRAALAAGMTVVGVGDRRRCGEAHAHVDRLDDPDLLRHVDAWARYTAAGRQGEPRIRARVPVALGRHPGLRPELVTFAGLEDPAEHLALVFGTAAGGTEAPLVRLHSECLTGDVFGSARCDCGPQLDEGIEAVGRQGGAVLYLRQEGRGIGLYRKLDSYLLQDAGLDTFRANRALGRGEDERSYAVAALMLRALGLRRIRLLTNNPDKVRQLRAHGIDVAEVMATGVHRTAENTAYLRAKAEAGGHTIVLPGAEDCP